jgi:hypothetical protein
VSGALFGAGWWFWVDAVSCSGAQIPFPQVGAAAPACHRPGPVLRLELRARG